jgi:hypothetical protein
MTSKKISIANKKINSCKEHGFFTEAVISVYHANSYLLTDIGKIILHEQKTDSKKPKAILKAIIAAAQTDEQIKQLAGKKNLKLLKPWFEKMSDFFDKLKVQLPRNTKQLLEEGEHVLNILNLTHQRILGNQKRI